MTRALVAMSGCFGFELDLNLLSGEELARVQQVVARVKALRETLLYGDFHRLLSPFEGHDTAWITVSGDRQEAILMALRDLAHPNGPPLLVQLSGLHADRLYRVEETGEIYGGDEMMYSGCSIAFPQGDAASVSRTLHAL